MIILGRGYQAVRLRSFWVVGLVLFLGVTNVRAQKTDGLWAVNVLEDHITGEKRTVLGQVRYDGARFPFRRAGKDNVPTSIEFACVRKSLVVIIAFANELVSGYDQFVTWRVDDKPAVRSATWRASVDGSAVGLWQTAQSRSFLNAVRDGQRLRVRIQHNVFGTTEAEFQVGNLTDAIKPILAECRVTL